jgi:predicted transcriptional regulator
MSTAAQQRVLAALADLERQHDGWTIPIRVIASHLGLSTPGPVHMHLRWLTHEGLVERSPFPKGGYRVKRTKEER